MTDITIHTDGAPAMRKRLSGKKAAGPALMPTLCRQKRMAMRLEF